MKTILLTTLMLGAALVAITPTASACEVSDPTGLGMFCVNEYEDGWGDPTCEDDGYGREGYRGNARAPGVGGMVFDVWQYCHKSPFRESEGTNLFATGGIIDTASFLIILYTWEDGDGQHCYLVVDTYSAAGNHGDGIDCSPPA